MSVSKDKDKIEEPKVDDNAGIKMSGHILIRDAETKEELVNKRNAIHYGNLGYLISQALGNQDNKIIHFMAFGNGATSVDSSGKVIYKSTNTSESRETSASLYRKTFAKVISNTAQNSDQASNKLEVIEGTLTGIKGQYLMFDYLNVLNIRKHQGYVVSIEY